MDTLDDVRRKNLFLLMSYVNGTVSKLALKVGITRSTVSAHIHGRAIKDAHARQYEKAFDKPFEWLDKEHVIDTVPTYDRNILLATMNCIYSVKGISDLYADLGIEGKTDLFDKLYHLFTDPAARELAPSTLFNMIKGIDYDAKNGTEDSNSTNAIK